MGHTGNNVRTKQGRRVGDMSLKHDVERFGLVSREKREKDEGDARASEEDEAYIEALGRRLRVDLEGENE